MRPKISPTSTRSRGLRRRWQRAFTLIEVVAATGVMSMALSSAIIVIQSGFSNLDLARTSTAASQAIQSEMERLRLMNWTGISELPASETLDLSEIHSARTLSGDRITVVREVSDVAGFGSPAEIKEITVTASWTSFSGTAHSRVFRMRYARNGLFDYYYNHATE